MISNLQGLTNVVTVFAQSLLGLGIVVAVIYKVLQPWLDKHGFHRNLRRTVQREAKIQDILQDFMQGVIDDGRKIERLHVYVLHNGRQNVLGQCEMAFSCMYEHCIGGAQHQKDTLRQLQTADHAWLIRKLCVEGVPIYANNLEYLKEHQSKYDSTYAIIARQGIKGIACVPLYRGNEIMGFILAQYSAEDQVDEQSVRNLYLLSGQLTPLIFEQRDRACAPFKNGSSPLEM